MKIAEIVEFLDEIAPFRSAESYDNVGLLVGDENAEITGVCCCLDITHDIINEAEEKGANLIVSHHPVIFDGLKIIPDWNPVSGLIRKNIAAIAMHTNFDIADGGVNDALLELLGFEKAEVLEVTQKDGKGFGAVCETPFEFTARALAEHCKKALFLDCVKYQKTEIPIKRVAVCCGAGVDENVMELAHEKGCHAIISGDIKHNFWIEAENRGMALVDAGHFGTEKAAAQRLAKIIADAVPSVPVFSAKREKDPCKYAWETNLK